MSFTCVAFNYMASIAISKGVSLVILASVAFIILIEKILETLLIYYLSFTNQYGNLHRATSTTKQFHKNKTTKAIRLSRVITIFSIIRKIGRIMVFLKVYPKFEFCNPCIIYWKHYILCRFTIFFFFLKFWETFHQFLLTLYPMCLTESLFGVT